MEELILKFIGYDLVSGTLHGMGDSMDTFSNKGKSAIEQLNGSLNKLSATAMHLAIPFAVVFAGIAAGAYNAIKAYNQFQSDVTLLTTHAGYAAGQSFAQQQKALSDMEDALLDLAPKVGYTADELAKAQYWVQSIGKVGKATTQDFNNLSNSMVILNNAAKVAQMSHADLSDTTNTLAHLMAAYGAGSDQAAKYASILNAAVGAGSLTMQQLNEALRTGLLPTAKDAGVSFDNVAAVLDRLTASGFTAATGATAVRNAFMYLTTGSAKARDDMKLLGLSTDDTIKLMHGPNGLVGAIQLVADKLHSGKFTEGQQDQIIADMFGRTRGSANIKDLINNIDQVHSKLDQIHTEAGQFNQDWSLYMSTNVYKTQSLHATLDAMRVLIGKSLSPAFQQLMADIGPPIARLFDWIQKNPQTVAEIIKLTLAVSGLGASFFGIIGIVTKLGAIFTSGPGLAMAAIVGILILVATHFDTVRSAAQTLATWFEAKFGPAISGVSDAVHQYLMPAWYTFEGWINGTGGTAFGKLKNAIGDLSHPIGALLNSIQHDVIPALGKLAGWIGDNLGPPFMRFASFIYQDALPALGQLIEWIGTNALPAFVHIVSAIMNFGNAVVQFLKPPIEWIVTTIGGEVLHILDYFRNHLIDIEVVLGLIAARFVVIKGLQLATFFIGLASSFTQFMQKYQVFLDSTQGNKMQALRNVFGMGNKDLDSKLFAGKFGEMSKAVEGLRDQQSLLLTIQERTQQSIEQETVKAQGGAEAYGRYTNAVQLLTKAKADLALMHSKLMENYQTETPLTDEQIVVLNQLRSEYGEVGQNINRMLSILARTDAESLPARMAIGYLVGDVDALQKSLIDLRGPIVGMAGGWDALRAQGENIHPFFNVVKTDAENISKAVYGTIAAIDALGGAFRGAAEAANATNDANANYFKTLAEGQTRVASTAGPAIVAERQMADAETLNGAAAGKAAGGVNDLAAAQARARATGGGGFGIPTTSAAESEIAAAEANPSMWGRISGGIGKAASVGGKLMGGAMMGTVVGQMTNAVGLTKDDGISTGLQALSGALFAVNPELGALAAGADLVYSHFDQIKSVLPGMTDNLGALRNQMSQAAGSTGNFVHDAASGFPDAQQRLLTFVGAAQGPFHSYGNNIADIIDKWKNHKISTAQAYNQLVSTDLPGIKSAMDAFRAQEEAKEKAFVLKTEQIKVDSINTVKQQDADARKQEMDGQTQQIMQAYQQVQQYAQVHSESFDQAVQDYAKVNKPAADLVTQQEGMRQQLHFSLDDWLNFGQSGLTWTGTVMGKTVTLTDNIAGLEAAVNSTWDSMSGFYDYTTQSIKNMLAGLSGVKLAAAKSNAGVGGGSQKSAEGGIFSTPTLTWVGEDFEKEWIIPRHKAPGWLAPVLDAAVAGRAPTNPPVVPVSTGGGTGGGASNSALSALAAQQQQTAYALECVAKSLDQLVRQQNNGSAAAGTRY